MDLTEDHKKEIWGKLVETIIAALRDDALSTDEYPAVSAYILEESEKVTNHDQMIQFLRDLSNKWSIFTHVLVEETGEVQKTNDLKTAQAAVDLAKSGNVDDAIHVIKSASEISGSTQ